MKNIEHINRREFLKRTGQASGGLVLALTMTTACQPKGPGGAEVVQSVAPNVYVNIRKDGVVEITCHRSEMGQGIRTCLPQVIADEMDADWDRIEVIQGLGDEKYASQNTDGSTSIRTQFDLLRGAGATAREMLIAAAAASWDVPEAECSTREHAVHHEATGRSAGFGDLVAAAAKLQAPEEVTFKSPENYRYIGKSMDIIDGFEMTTGGANYGFDTVLPDMLFASIERSPVFGGIVRSLDDTAARAVAGVRDVLQLPETQSPPAFNPLHGVAVLADNSWAAMQGRKALAIEWDAGANAGYDSAAYRKALTETAEAGGRVVLDRGDVDAAFAGSDSIHEAVYFAPHLSQAPMEPPAATARMTEEGGCEIWACTQDPQAAQNTIAALLEIDKQDVKVHVTLLGGGFGRKSKADFIAEAAWLARETERPVKVTWTREDDLRHGYLHSVSAQCMKAGLDADGNAVAMQHCTAFPSIFSTFDPSTAGPVAMELGLGAVDNPYALPNMRVMAGDAKAHLRIGWMRSVCNIFHAFACCSFVDELAYLAGMDPRDHLLKLLGPARLVNPVDDGAEYTNYAQPLETHPIDTGRIAAVVEKVAEMAGWGRVLTEGHGLGIAVHRSFLSTIATVAEVSTNDNGKLVVHELWMAVDAGLVVNPDRVTSQMEGAGIFGMSLALHGEITAKDGAVEQGNFDTYPVVRMNEAPEAIHVHIMDVDAPPGGVGEPGVPPVAPAIINAYFAATGIRIRELPLRNSGLA